MFTLRIFEVFLGFTLILFVCLMVHDLLFIMFFLA